MNQKYYQNSNVRSVILVDWIDDLIQSLDG